MKLKLSLRLHQDLKNVLSGHLGQVDFLDGQVTFKAPVPIGQDSRQDILQLKYVDQ